MQKTWLKSYPPEVPAEIDAGAYHSLVDLLEESYKTFATRDAAHCMGGKLTFAEVDRMSIALGAFLQSKGLPLGARVAVMLPNVLQYMPAIAGILRAGYVVVNVNPLYTARELEHQLTDSGTEAIIVLENFARTLEQVILQTQVKHVIVCAMGDLLGSPKGSIVNFVVRNIKKLVPEFRLPSGDGHSVTRFNSALAAGSRQQFKRAAVGPDHVAFLQYTGGTTGVSKGATLLHRNVVANILQCDAWFGTKMRLPDNRQAVQVCALPLYHIFALTVCYMLGARLGTLNVLIPNPRDLPGLIKTLGKYRVHMFPAVNTLFNGLVNHPDFGALDFSELMISNGGGMAVQQSTAEKWKKATGCPISEGYGLSETSPVVSCNRLDIAAFTGTIGLPFPSTEVSIRDDEGRDLPLGEAGEICIRGPQVMAGYWRRPDETAKVMAADGFFKSGDIGVMDAQGQIKIVDRKKDMILVSGFNVYPTEIEQVVGLHPGVLECAAIGIADERTGEAVKLYVVRRDSTLTEQKLAAYCIENFTAYKRPKAIEFRTDLPKSNVGKILRRELRDK